MRKMQVERESGGDLARAFDDNIVFVVVVVVIPFFLVRGSGGEIEKKQAQKQKKIITHHTFTPSLNKRAHKKYRFFSSFGVHD